MRVLQVVAGLAPSHGGPSYSAPRLCEALIAQGAEVVLHAVADPSEQSPVAAAHFHSADYDGVPVLGALRSSAQMRRALIDEAVRSDIVHNHGLWLLPNVYAAQAATRGGRPFVVSPRGMLALEALRFSKWKKRLFWQLVQSQAFRETALWHATSDQEASEIRAFGITAPIAVIPNGIDLPPASQDAPRGAPGRSLLSLGRLHPKKGLDRLVRAWATVSSQRPDWRLRIVGPDEGGHAAALRALASELAAPRLDVEPALYGDDKWRALRSADIFVLPTRSENFGLSVAEALAAGTPVICTTGAPWEGLRSEGCGWWIDQGVEPLAAALLEATDVPPEHLKAMGGRGRAWMERDFGWDAVASHMMSAYAWLIRGGAPPPCVQVGLS